MATMALSGLDDTPVSVVSLPLSSPSPSPPSLPCRSWSAPTSVKLSQLVNPAVCFSAQPLSLRDLRNSAAFEPPSPPSSPAPPALSDCRGKHQEKDESRHVVGENKNKLATAHRFLVFWSVRV